MGQSQGGLGLETGRMRTRTRKALLPQEETRPGLHLRAIAKDTVWRVEKRGSCAGTEPEGCLVWAAKGALGYSMSKRVILTLECVAQRTSGQKEPEPGSQGAWLGMQRGDTGCRGQ